MIRSGVYAGFGRLYVGFGLTSAPNADEFIPFRNHQRPLHHTLGMREARMRMALMDECAVAKLSRLQ